MQTEGVVRLQCVQDGKQLRVRIVSSGYSSSANCRFPRAIRVVGKEWEVPKSAVKLQGGSGKFYYTIATKELREVQPEVKLLDISKLHVYDVTEEGECTMCLEVIPEDDMIIIAPCGHKCGCMGCLLKCQACPLCRTAIGRLVKRSELE
jgi:hypothetical protein